LLTDRELRVAGPAVRLVQDAVRRRAVEREPVAYITGRRAFRHLELAVDRRALIPRPETELLVEVGVELGLGSCVLDLGTGSGAIALALKDERPDLDVSASDVSADALALARENGLRLGLEVRWLHADLARGGLTRGGLTRGDLLHADVLDGIADEFDAILSNPPYVAASERALLAPEILRHEPPEALFAGADGLDVIRALVAQLSAFVRIRLVALEVGAGQAAQVAQLLRGAGFEAVDFRRDLARIERVVVGRRTGP
jgi:release factor glutamine methyltransferase